LLGRRHPEDPSDHDGVIIETEQPSFVFETLSCPPPSANTAAVVASTPQPAPVAAATMEHQQQPAQPLQQQRQAYDKETENRSEGDQLSLSTAAAGAAKPPLATSTRLSSVLNRFRRQQQQQAPPPPPEDDSDEEDQSGYRDNITDPEEQQQQQEDHQVEEEEEEEPSEEDQFLDALSPKEAQEVVAGIIQSIERLKVTQTRLLIEREAASRALKDLTSVTLQAEHAVTLARLIWGICDTKLVRHFAS
jgi:hypothetical protein